MMQWSALVAWGWGLGQRRISLAASVSGNFLFEQQICSPAISFYSQKERWWNNAWNVLLWYGPSLINAHIREGFYVQLAPWCEPCKRKHWHSPHLHRHLSELSLSISWSNQLLYSTNSAYSTAQISLTISLWTAFFLKPHLNVVCSWMSYTRLEYHLARPGGTLICSGDNRVNGSGWRQLTRWVSNAILCGDRARRERQMQVRLPFWLRSRATFCGDRARRDREMQVRLRLWGVARNPLPRSRASRARKAGEIAFCLRSRATPCGDRARRDRETQVRLRLWGVARNPLRRSCASRARNAGEIAFLPCLCNPLRRSRVSRARTAGEIAFLIGRAQTSADIVRAESAQCTDCVCEVSRATLCAKSCVSRSRKCRWNCVLYLSNATLCGDRACWESEKRVRLHFGLVARSPLRTSCVSRARNAGEIAFLICPMQPSAEIVRVEGAKGRAGEIAFWIGRTSAHIVRVESTKCRWDRVFDWSLATLCGDRACARASAAASGQKLRYCANLRSLIGRLRERLREFFLGSLC